MVNNPSGNPVFFGRDKVCKVPTKALQELWEKETSADGCKVTGALCCCFGEGIL